MEGWMEWFCGSVRAVRVTCRFSGLRFFAVHRAERFLAVRFRFAVRFAAFLHQTPKPSTPIAPCQESLPAHLQGYWPVIEACRVQDEDSTRGF